METLFFIASKLVWALLKPPTWIVLLAGGTFLALLMGASKTATRLSGATLALILLLGIVPIGSLALRPLEAQYPANPPLTNAAGVIVLGGGEIGTLSQQWGQPQVNEGGDRFLATLALAERFPNAVVLFTGGIGSLRQDGLSGADVAEDLFLSASISSDRLVLEGTSRNTAENAQNALQLRDPSEPGNWVLVTSAFHMPRAIETFCAAGWTDLVPWPTDYQGEGFIEGLGWNLTGNLALLETGLKEHIGRLAYRLTGRADPKRNEDCLARLRS